ncbi:hypothetical protein BU25DRAFT_461813 [Macroventuria anomochaeta]|uniref:Uncharacterized protein n=1 Tax=Macroventuria anomochaeta TaxID=301207 RepID=A0ACB6RRF6_9PLEO|nr:uncharacterized protein BU25DRAFT_461813 [Macroventuria anomochaeta]KAF2623729.1 hypothetical protein BU25DRAFT_461813 [Macroventuria anomochaeta]
MKLLCALFAFLFLAAQCGVATAVQFASNDTTSDILKAANIINSGFFQIAEFMHQHAEFLELVAQICDKFSEKEYTGSLEGSKELMSQLHEVTKVFEAQKKGIALLTVALKLASEGFPVLTEEVDEAARKLQEMNKLPKEL